jgi:hypothetical protein
MTHFPRISEIIRAYDEETSCFQGRSQDEEAKRISRDVLAAQFSREFHTAKTYENIFASHRFDLSTAFQDNL